ncbi:hypothetical protein [Chroococcidiopsis sp. CCNUC1]|uniref:hypothetical protein n=1 Tax=Chroococcidiopsis sp. CCNUC1 TaxID=2653189 RepID=UPI00201FEC12|nr:hypothetical protein [Chroococcidiopsis sp. CCNUC1]URD48849.1 hypothetical protein M5J74_21270 [Chroococcidiopsis sp. CCNUC1]
MSDAWCVKYFQLPRRTTPVRAHRESARTDSRLSTPICFRVKCKKAPVPTPDSRLPFVLE